MAIYLIILKLCLMHHNHYLDLLNKYLGNVHDSKTISAIIEQIKKLTDQVPNIAATDQGYRRISNYEGCEIVHADKLRKKSLNKYEKIKIKKMLKKGCGIEEIISSLKNYNNYNKLSKNYLSGSFGKRLNLLLAAIGYNLKKGMRIFYFSFKYIYFFVSKQKQ